MKLQQLKFLAAIAQNELNITSAASKLRASQPALSRQLKLLEDELGFTIFQRSGRTLTKITPHGQKVIARALRILQETQAIKRISEETRGQEHGTLAIGTTHTQARYVLPPVIQQFRAKYPDVDLHLHQGTSEQIAEMARLDRIDFAIATGSRDLFETYVLLPCYRWHRRIVVPEDHPLAKIRKPALKQLAAYPIVTYVFSFDGPSSLSQLFAKAGLKLNVALTARDADVIKTYVRLGLGVGIIADVAVTDEEDRDLVAIDASHLFPVHTTWIGFARGGLLRGYMYDFMQLFAPHLTRRIVDRCARAEHDSEITDLFAKIELPLR
jgi:LysR family transcriptional regulator, cys regulon transcriptional activator